MTRKTMDEFNADMAMMAEIEAASMAQAETAQRRAKAETAKLKKQRAAEDAAGA